MSREENCEDNNLPIWGSLALYVSYVALTAGSKPIVEIVAVGFAGIAALAGATLSRHQRLLHRGVRAQSSRMDIFVLVLLYWRSR